MNEELKIIIKAITDNAKKGLAGIKKELKDIEGEGKKASSTLDKALRVIKRGAIATVAAVSALTVALVKLGKASDEFRIASQKVNTAFQSMGGSAKQAEKTFGGLFRFLGDTDRAAETAQSLALITTNEKELAEWTKILQGAFGVMGDKLPIEGLAEAANETIKVGVVSGVLADALNWMGVSEDAFNASLARTNSLSEREALLRSTLISLYGGSADMYEKNNITALRFNESQYRLNQALANTAKYTLPLRIELNNLSAAILTVLAPAIELVCAYLTAFIQIIISAIEWVGSFFGMLSSGASDAQPDYEGYRKALQKYLDSLQSGFEKADEGGSDVVDTLKAIKKQTMGFDELNILSSPTTSAPTGTGAAGSSSSIPEMPKPEDYNIGGKQVDEFSEKIAKAKTSLKILMGVAAAVGTTIAGWKVVNFFKELKSLKVGVEAVKNATDILGNEGFEKKFGVHPQKVIRETERRIDGMTQALKNFAGVASIVAGITLLVSGIKDFVANGYSMEAVLKVLGGAILTAVGIMLIFNAALLANPITWIVIGIAALVAAFVILWNECDGFRQFWIDLWDGIKKVWSGFVKSIQPLIDAIVRTFKAGWELVKVIFTKVWDNIKEKWNEAKPYFELLWENIKVVFEGVKVVLSAFIIAAWESIKAVWDGVVAYFTAIWDTIAGIFSVVKAVLSGNWRDAWEAIKGIVNSWGKFFAQAWDSIKRIFSSVDTFFKVRFTAAWNAVKQIFSNVDSFFGGVLTKIMNVLKKAASAIGTAVSDTFKGAINWVLESAIKKINNFINAINFAVGIINKIPGVNIGTISTLEVPKLATGGVVDGATLAMVGERGKEAVVPLENNTEWMDLLAERLNGNAPTKLVLQVDGKALGEATIKSINGITQQSGKLQLILG